LKNLKANWDSHFRHT